MLHGDEVRPRASSNVRPLSALSLVVRNLPEDFCGKRQNAMIWGLLTVANALTPACTEIPLGRDYTQETAPQDISLFEQEAWLRVNEHAANISRVSISYVGSDIKGVSVGPRKIEALIWRKDADGLETLSDCTHMTYTVLDTDECTTTDKLWRHKCDASAVCRNTVGGYECACAGNETFGARGSGSMHKRKFLSSASREQGYCWGHRDTVECCHVPDVFQMCDVEACVDACRSDFRCTSEACEAARCPAHASCYVADGAHSEMWAASDEKRAELRGGFECVCDAGYEDDGEGGCMPTLKPDWCANHECPCNCQCVPDDRKRGYTCKAEPGYKKIEDNSSKPVGRLDSGVCIHASMPTLSVIGSNPYRLRQGDDYVEHGAHVVDDNLEKTRPRKMIVTFPDRPLGRCVDDIGQYHVNYQLDVDWLSDGDSPPPGTTATRTVIVDDVDECSYDGPCEQFIPTCSKDAICHNVVGSYECRCPNGYAGDGRLDGFGCADKRPPTLKCNGAGCKPKLFRAADIHGLVSEDKQYVDVDTSNFTWITARLEQIFQSGKQQDLDVFCETGELGKPCFVAYDDIVNTTDGSTLRVDITPNVTMSAIAVPDSTDVISTVFHANTTVLRFNVTYVVADYAGNTASTTRDILVAYLSDDMVAQLTRGRLAVVIGRFVLASLALGLVGAVCLGVWAARHSIVNLLLIAPFTLAYLLLPAGLFQKIAGRKHFIAAVDLWLAISRLGLLSEHDRLTFALQEWSLVQNRYDELDD